MLEPKINNTKVEPIAMPIIGRTVHSFRVENVSVNIDAASADFHVTLFDENGGLVMQKGVHIDGDEYAAWGTDDTYLISLAAQKLNLTRI